MSMSRVRSPRKAIGDPNVHTFVQHSHFRRQIIEVYRISNRSNGFIEAQAKRRGTAVRLIDAVRAEVSELLLPADFVALDDRTVEIGLLEGVAEAHFELVEGVGAPVQRHGSPEGSRNRSKLVYAMAMIAVSMSGDDRVDDGNTSVEQLLSQVRPTIDEHLPAIALDQDRRAKPAIPRLFWIATAPIVADLGNAGRRSAA